MSIPGIILSAGESRRMGRHKALLPLGNGTFLSVLAETLSIYCSPVYAVFGADAQYLSRTVPPGVIAVENPDYRHGMLTSLQVGLRAIGDLPERILFTLVDHPLVQMETIRALSEVNAPIVIARYAGNRGHPVVMNRALAETLLAEPIETRTNEFIDRHGASIRYVDLNDPAICEDIDDPTAYENLLAREAAVTQVQAAGEFRPDKSPQLIDHFRNPRNVGQLPAPAIVVEVSNPICGDILLLSALFECGRVIRVAFKVRGCTATIGAGSALTELMAGQDCAELSKITSETVEDAVGGLSNESKHAAVLCVTAVQEMLKAVARGLS